MSSELTDRETEEIRKLLKRRFLDLREEIRQELISSDNQHYVDLAGQVHDLEEESLADLLVDLELADIDRHIQEIRAIDAALISMSEGRYGLCAKCGNPIDKKRLRAVPTAQRCYRCQALHEKTYIQRGQASL